MREWAGLAGVFAGWARSHGILRRYLHAVVPDSAEEIFRTIMNAPCNSIEWVNGQPAPDLKVATRVEAPGEDLFGPLEERLGSPTPSRP
jgi:hypothetical protein